MHPQGINRQQLEQSKKLIEAKLGLWKNKLAAHIKYSSAERAIVTEFVENDVQSPIKQDTLYLWLEMHKLREQSETEIISVEIAQLESQVFIANELLKQADTGLFVPSGIREQ